MTEHGRWIVDAHPYPAVIEGATHVLAASDDDCYSGRTPDGSHIPATGRMIAIVTGDGAHEHANLIAAAPDLLAALEEAAGFFERGSWVGPEVDAVFEAIALARGAVTVSQEARS